MADNQLLNEIGDEIKDALKVGLSQGDFTALKDAILGSVNKVIDEATDQLERSTGYSNGRPINVSTHKYSSYASGAATRAKQMQLEKEREERRRRSRELARKNREAADARRSERQKARRAEEALRRKMNSPDAIVLNGKLLPTKFKAKFDAGSVLAIVFGCVGLVMFGGLAFVFGIAMSEDISLKISFILFGFLTALSTYLMGWGISLRNTLERARKYAKICGEKMYARVSQLASASGRSERTVRKDIKKMLNKGFFPEGYMDEEGTTLMLSESVYKDYDRLKRQQEADEANARAAEAERLSNEAKSELEQMVDEGMAAVDKLHKLNDDIPGEVISQKLYVLEDLLKQIFARVREHPEQMDRMHKLMDYYLPTMLKLVEAYAEYDKVSAPGPEILQAKGEIEKTLDTINEAFTQLLNNLFQDSVWDVTSDAKVLTTMLTQEGLTQEATLKTQ